MSSTLFFEPHRSNTFVVGQGRTSCQGSGLADQARKRAVKPAPNYVVSLAPLDRAAQPSRELFSGRVQ